ncbi:hypothetical protein C8J57DRAFT_1254817 [Mycena rebaudengoi]|nr:hypothetical protein C8J57DRAFT_1254817 [Mycena rebaudengoi]
MAHQSRRPMGVVHVPTANDVHSPVPLNDDVVREILHRLDIIALSHYGLFSKAHAATALGLLKERVKCYTLPFFPNERAWTTFFEALEEFESWINGSVPLEALSLQSRPEVPTNLNVLLSHVHELNWANSDDVLGFRLDSSVTSSGRWDIVGKRYTSFTHQHVPQHRNIRVVFGRNAYGPAKHHFRLRANMLQCSPDRRADSSRGMEAPRRERAYTFPDAVTHERNTAEWSEPCGIYCPRTTHGLRGVGHWKWGGVNVNDHREMDPSLRRMGEQRILWRTGFSDARGPASGRQSREAGELYARTMKRRQWTPDPGSPHPSDLSGKSWMAKKKQSLTQVSGEEYGLIDKYRVHWTLRQCITVSAGNSRVGGWCMMEYIDYQWNQVEAHSSSVDGKTRTPNSSG